MRHAWRSQMNRSFEAGSFTATPHSRREMLAGSVSLAAAPVLLGLAGCGAAQPGNPGEIKGSAVAQRSEMGKRRLGSLEVSELGFGCMNFVWAYGSATDRQDAIKLIRAAYDNGHLFRYRRNLRPL